VKDDIKKALVPAMKAREAVRVETIRALLTAIQYEEVAAGTENLPAATVTEILKREVKKRKEELEFVAKARPDGVAKLNEEIATIEGFLPKQMSASELEGVITQIKSSNPAANMGVVMKLLKEQHAGLYDSKLASDLAKRIAG
jgi:hypothetical protein